MSRIPRLISGNPPEYNKVLRSAGVAGIVEVQVTVDDTGRVAQATALSGPVPLRMAAERAVRTWRYEPANREWRSHCVSDDSELPLRAEVVVDAARRDEMLSADQKKGKGETTRCFGPCDEPSSTPGCS